MYVTDGYGFSDHFPPYLHMFTTDGQFVTSSTEIRYGVYGVAVGADGCLYLSNPIEKWLAKYTSDMTLVCRWGTYGPNPGQIDWPLGLTTDGSGRIYFTEPDTHYVQVFGVAHRPPVANAGPDQTIECCCQQGGTQVTLDGSGSSDPGGNPLTYKWMGPFQDGDVGVGGVNPTVKLVPGCRDSYEITLVVNDGKQDSSPDTVQITVQDTTAPLLTCPEDITVVAQSPSGVPASDPAIVAFLQGASASDNCDPAPAISHDAPDQFPLGSTVVTFTATDAASNRSTDQAIVMVIVEEDFYLHGVAPDLTLDMPSRRARQQSIRTRRACAGLSSRRLGRGRIRFRQACACR